MNTIKQNCLFAKAKIQKLIFNTLVDTGSAVNLISKKSFDKLDISSSALHKVTTTLTSAEGSGMKVYGKIELKFSISNKVFEHKFLVADLHQMSGILGMDFFEKFDVSLNVGKAHMLVSGYKIRLYKLSHQLCANVKLEDSVVIPPDSEIVIETYISGKVMEDISVLEPRRTLMKNGLMIARTICEKN